MIRIPGRIPISIHPFFWVLAGLIGWLNSGSFAGTLLWMVVILISVLFHEFGHALTAYFFGQNPRIDLVAMGGLTTYESKGLKFWKQFLIVLNGPLFGALLFFIATFVLYLNFFTNLWIVSFFKIAQIVNLFWSIVNLLPVLPLDGGQLLRIALEAAFGVKGFRCSLFIGALIALLLSVFFFVKGGFLIGAIFFLFAFQSFDAWRKAKFLTQADRNVEKASLLNEGEKALREGRKEQAKEIFLQIRASKQKGMLYAVATHYLAMLEFEKGDKEKAYQLFLEIADRLSDEAKCVLHALAYEHKNYQKVADLATKCYQINPCFAVAFHNAKAFASLSKAKLSGGWLQTAMQHKKLDLEEVLKEEEFQKIRNDKNFQKFFSSSRK